MTNPNRKSLLIIFAFFAVAVLLLTVSSCYTILRHPRIKEANHERPSGERCIDCHNEDEIWRFHNPHTNYWDYPVTGWRSIFDVPWWYDDYWFYTDPENPESTPIYRRSLRPNNGKGGDSTIYSPRIYRLPGKTKSEEPDDTQDTGKLKENENQKKKSEKRSVRPSKKKKKDG